MIGHSMNSKPRLSIIVPVLNEEVYVEAFIEALQDKAQNGIELIFVDGGSSDNTLKKLEKYPHVKVYTSPSGRAKQMNFGAHKALGDILYFVHVDSFPPQNFDQLIVQQIEQSQLAGCFQMRFDQAHILFRCSSYATKFNNRWCRGGDQTLFISQELFKLMGGFDESYLICEDGEFIDRLYQQKQFVILPQKVITSARKFRANGIWRLYFHHFVIHSMRFLGIPPVFLYKYYLFFVK